MVNRMWLIFFFISTSFSSYSMVFNCRSRFLKPTFNLQKLQKNKKSHHEFLSSYALGNWHYNSGRTYSVISNFLDIFYLYWRQEFRIIKPRDRLHTCLGRTSGYCELSDLKTFGDGHAFSNYIILRLMPLLKQQYQQHIVQRETFFRTAYASSTGRRYDLAFLSLWRRFSPLYQLPFASPACLTVRPFTLVEISAFNPSSRQPSSLVHQYFPHSRPGRCILERLPSTEEWANYASEHWLAGPWLPKGCGLCVPRGRGIVARLCMEAFGFPVMNWGYRWSVADCCFLHFQKLP